MAFEKFGDGSALKRQNQRELAVIRGCKPEVDITDASIIKWHGSDKEVLVGIPINHPNQYLNGQEIRSSAIVKIEGNTVETRNTLYNVLSWHQNDS